MKTLTKDEVMPIWELAKLCQKSEDTPLPSDFDHRLATLLEIADRPFSTSIDAAYSLLDEVKPADADYMNVGFREYPKGGYVICDINDDYGVSFEGSCRGGANRIIALVVATLSAVVSQVEMEFDNA